MKSITHNHKWQNLLYIDSLCSVYEMHITVWSMPLKYWYTCLYTLLFIIVLSSLFQISKLVFNGMKCTDSLLEHCCKLIPYILPMQHSLKQKYCCTTIHVYDYNFHLIYIKNWVKNSVIYCKLPLYGSKAHRAVHSPVPTRRLATIDILILFIYQILERCPRWQDPLFPNDEIKGRKL